MEPVELRCRLLSVVNLYIEKIMEKKAYKKNWSSPELWPLVAFQIYTEQRGIKAVLISIAEQ